MSDIIEKDGKLYQLIEVDALKQILEELAGLKKGIEELQARPISYPYYPLYIPIENPVPINPIMTYTTTGTTSDGSGIRKEPLTAGP